MIGVEMAVTKDYAARNYGVRDLVIEGLEVTVGILIVAFVMLFLSGVLGSGQFISAKVSLPTAQSQVDSVGQ
jgi:flagellar biosynthesis protein FliR